jgi:hypothetical protein
MRGPRSRVAVCTENLSAGVAHLASALEPLESPEGNREAANSPAPSRMKEVEHGATVDNVAYEMAPKMQSNETTLHFLAALDFGGEPGEDAVDAALEEPANGAAQDLSSKDKPAAPVSAAELGRADIASACAAQFMEGVDNAEPTTVPAGARRFCSPGPPVSIAVSHNPSSPTGC